METSYAQALWKVIERGMAPKKAVLALHESLVTRGRQALMPHIARAFARIAARDQGRNGVVLSIAHENDERKAKRATEDILSEMDIAADDVKVAVDETLIGGWRLEGRERLVDASYKKFLLDVYNAATRT